MPRSFMNMSCVDEQEFCEVLAELYKEEDHDDILVDFIAHQLVKLGYLETRDVAEKWGR